MSGAQQQQPAPTPFWTNVAHNAIAGGGAGVTEICLMYPTDVIKTRVQLSSTSQSMVTVARSILSEQGIRGFYRGIVSPITAEAPKRAWKFAANDFFKAQMKQANGGVLTTTGASVSGALAGISEALINCPFEVVKVRMQAKENLARFANTRECMVALIKEEGALALYKGLEPQMWRNALWNGAYFGTVGLVGIHFQPAPGASKAEQLFSKFSAGVVGSTVGTVLNTPCDVVKSRMQNQPAAKPGAPPPKYRHTLQSVALIIREEGPAAAWRGLGPRLLRLGPGGGVMIVMYSTIMDMITGGSK